MNCVASLQHSFPDELRQYRTWYDPLQHTTEKKGLTRSQPPKRKAAASGGAAPKARQSKLAKEHNVTPQEEGEIREAFSLFAEPMDGEKHGVLPIDDVKSALM